MNFVDVGVYERVRRTLVAYPDVHMKDAERISEHFTVTGEYTDGSHIIELQLSRDSANDKCTLAARFSLCSFDSIDPIFVDLVCNVLSSFDADVWLMTSALKQKDNYPPGESNWLRMTLPEEIKAMREYWQGLFGHKQGAVRVNDSFSFVGVNVP